MRKVIYAIILLTLCCAFVPQSFAATSDLAARDWSANTPNNLMVSRPRESDIIAFAAKLEGVDSAKPYLRLCFSQFADLRRAGYLSLVVSISDGRFCWLYTIDKIPSGFEMFSLDLAHGADGPQIKDLAGDGNLELVVDTDFTSYEGTRYCEASWPVIYAWTGSSYSDVSRQFPGFYTRELTSLTKQNATNEAGKDRGEEQSVSQDHKPTAVVNNTAAAGQQSASEPADSSGQNAEPAAQESVKQGSHGSFSVTSSGPVVFPAPTAPPQGPPPPDKFGLDCTKAEAAKIERFLGISRDAGMSDAIRWANSNDPDTRIFAADILADIGTAEAVRYLKTLSHDPNQGVAMSAKSGLVVVGRGPVTYTVDREPVSTDAGK